MQTSSPSLIGLGTTQVQGPPGVGLDPSTLSDLLGPSKLAQATGCDIQVISGPMYLEVDGSVVDLTKKMLATGSEYSVRNSPKLLADLSIAAEAGYDLRITLYIGG